MRQGHFCPDSAFQQAIIVPIELLADRDALGVEVLQRCPVALFLFDVANVNLIDEPMLALGGHLGLSRIRLVRPNVVFLQRRQHGLHARIHLCLVVASAIFGEQKLQDERRDVGALFNPMQQVLTKYLTVECGV